MTAEQRAELTRMAASSSLPHRRVMQAKALLWAGDGVANQEIARRCGVDLDGEMTDGDLLAAQVNFHLPAHVSQIRDLADVTA